MVRRPPDTCVGFPTHAIGGQRIWRVTKNEHRHRPWWFASLPLDDGDEDGRFDLPQPRGTCYWATEPLAAAAEVLLRDAERGTLPVSMLQERTIVDILAPDVALADLSHPGAAAYGVTNQLSSDPRPYDVPQEWAQALDEVADGVHYPASQHTSGRNCGFFGASGQGTEEPDNALPLLDIQREIEVGLRLRFWDPPALAELEPVVDPPKPN